MRYSRGGRQQPYVLHPCLCAAAVPDSPLPPPQACRTSRAAVVVARQHGYGSSTVLQARLCVPSTHMRRCRYRGARIQMLDLPGIIEGAKDGKGRGRQVGGWAEAGCVWCGVEIVWCSVWCGRPRAQGTHTGVLCGSAGGGVSCPSTTRVNPDARAVVAQQQAAASPASCQTCRPLDAGLWAPRATQSQAGRSWRPRGWGHGAGRPLTTNLLVTSLPMPCAAALPCAHALAGKAHLSPAARCPRVRHYLYHYRQVISTARTCNLILIILDCLKPLSHKRLIGAHGVWGFQA